MTTATQPAPKKKATKAEPAPAIEVGNTKNLPAFSAMPPIVFSVTESVLAKIRADVATIPKINGVEDKKGFQVVRTARLALRSLRADIENERKELKAGALEYGRKLDAEAKSLTAQIEELENPLAEQEKEIEDAKEAIAAAAQAARDKRNQARYDALSAVGVVVDFNEAGKIVALTDEEFEARLARETEAYELKVLQEQSEAEELARLRAEDEARKAEQAEADRIKAEADAAAIEARRKENEAEAARLAAIKAEQDKREADLKAAADRLAQEAAIKAATEAAAEKARKDAEAKAEQDAKDAAARAERDRIEAERVAAMAPDKEKALAYLDGLRKVAIPEMATEQGKAVMARFLASMKASAAILTELAKA